MASVSARQASDQTRRPTPLERYQEDLKRSDFQYDSAQEQAVKHLQRLYDELVSAPTTVPKAIVASKGIKAKMAGLLGKKNEPAYVVHVAEKIAELKEMSLEEVAQSTTNTALGLFKKLSANN